MDTEKCTAFLKTLELGTMSAAAEELGYTVSGISRLIVSMEEETGFCTAHVTVFFEDHESMIRF